MSRFIEWLESANARDTRVRAVLRRGLAFEPGTYPPAFPWVEPFLTDDVGGWRRAAHYLVAALWAAHWKEGRSGDLLSMGRAVAHHAHQRHTHEQLDSGASSTERRFVALLDSDADQLGHRLRQMVALLKDERLDFGALLGDLLRWHAAHKPAQQQWARDYYRAMRPDPVTDHTAPAQEENP